MAMRLFAKAISHLTYVAHEDSLSELVVSRNQEMKTLS